MAGFSFGGLVVLKTLEFDESKIKAVFLSSPAYIVNGNPLKALFKVFIPMRRYMKTKNPKYVERFLEELFTDEDQFAIKYLSKVFLVLYGFHTRTGYQLQKSHAYQDTYYNFCCRA